MQLIKWQMQWCLKSLKSSKTYHNIFSPSEHTNIKISDQTDAQSQRHKSLR